MNQAPIETGLSPRQPSEKTLLEQIRKELWPVAQQLLRTLNSVLKTSPLEVTSSQTLDGVDDFIKVDATAGNVTLTLPTAEAWMRSITVIKTDASGNTVTVTPVASGDPVLGAQWDVARVTQDGSLFYEV